MEIGKPLLSSKQRKYKKVTVEKFKDNSVVGLTFMRTKKRVVV